MSITVKATNLGYYGLKRRKVGDVFEIEHEKDFSKKWMKKVKDEPESAEDKRHAKEEAAEDKRHAKEGAAEDKRHAKEEASEDRKHAR